MFRSLAATVALSLGAAACVHGKGTPQDPRVDAVVFKGVKAVDDADLADVLATHGPVSRPGVEGFIRDRQRFDPEALPTDVERIKAYYRARGYYDARVDEPEIEPAGRGLVRIVFRVTEGRPARVSKLEIEGLDAAPEAARRLDRLPLRIGEVFRTADYDATREAIESALRNSGWATATVTQSATVLPAQDAAEVRYVVTPGVRYRFGPIFVGRVVGIPPKKIQDQVSAVIKTGDWWDESRLAVAKRRVFELGVFGAVRVAHADPDPRKGSIPVVIELVQAKYQTIRTGPGASFDPTRWQAQAEVGWTHRNFLGDLRRLSLDGRAGYAWVPTPFTPRKQGTVWSVTADFQQPGALSRWVDLSARAQVEKGIEDAYDYVAQRLRLGLPLRLYSRLVLVPSINLEFYELSNTSADFVPGQVPPSSGSTTEPVLENCNGNLCVLGYLEQFVAWDARDNPVNTRSGWYAALNLQEGLSLSGYGYRYFRFQPELRAFYPVSRRAVAAIRTRLGGLVPVKETGDPPVVARFYAGGPVSMRGYYTNRLAPMVRQEGSWVPVGGNGVIDGSAEVRVALGGSWGAVAFVDAAGISNYSANANAYREAFSNIQWASGLGLRYRTPFGPLRADVGVRLPDNFSSGVPFHERFPAVPYTFWPPPDNTPHREPIIAIQIALGEAF